MSVFRLVADVQTADMLNLPVPKANFHTEVIKPSELQQEYVAQLAERAEDIRAGAVKPEVDNMLRITNEGRKLALDMRLVQPLAPREEDGKVSVCARNVHRIWEETTECKGAQLVFCDLSTPQNDGSFNVYDELKTLLTEKGIPAEEIAYIHDANTEARKKELFAKVRSGQVRVLIGSTAKMGAGTNVQDRLVALHDVDCPWRPSDLAQRLGRIVRQGNENAEVDIFRYVTENTFDAYLFQLVENKQKFISQIMTSKTPVRVAEDVDETALSYSEIKALATGNPLIIEKCNLEVEVAKLVLLKSSYMNQLFYLQNLVLRKCPSDLAETTERLQGYENDLHTLQAHPKPEEGFVGMEVDGKFYTERKEAGAALITAIGALHSSEPVHIGQYRGFSLILRYDKGGNEYKLSMKGKLSHTIALGGDAVGNITRIERALDFEPRIEKLIAEIEEINKQMADAKAALDIPFSKEEELAEKAARLKQLDILLNMDEKDRTLLDDEPEEDMPDRVVSKDVER